MDGDELEQLPWAELVIRSSVAADQAELSEPLDVIRLQRRVDRDAAWAGVPFDQLLSASYLAVPEELADAFGEPIDELRLRLRRASESPKLRHSPVHGDPVVRSGARRLTPPPHRSRSGYVLIGLVVAALVLVVGLGVDVLSQRTGDQAPIATPAPVPATPDPSVGVLDEGTISSPVDGKGVAGPLWAKGTARLADDQRLWLMVSPPSPDDSGFGVYTLEPISVDASGQWRSRANVGYDTCHIGENYVLVLVAEPAGGTIERGVADAVQKAVLIPRLGRNQEFHAFFSVLPPDSHTLATTRVTLSAHSVECTKG